MIRLCESCNIKFKLWFNFKQHLLTNKHKQNSHVILTQNDILQLEINRTKYK